MIVADYTIVQDDYFAPPKVLKFSLPSDFFLGSGAVLSFVVQTKQANSLVYRVLVNGQALMTSASPDGDNQFAIHEVIDAGKFGLTGGGPHQVSFEIFSGSAFGSYFPTYLSHIRQTGRDREYLYTAARRLAPTGFGAATPGTS